MDVLCAIINRSPLILITVLIIESKRPKMEKNSHLNDFNNPNQSVEVFGGNFRRPSKRIISALHRSMSLETQLSELDNEDLKNSKGCKRLSNKRRGRKSCEEIISSKVPKVLLTVLFYTNSSNHIVIGNS